LQAAKMPAQPGKINRDMIDCAAQAATGCRVDAFLDHRFNL
jgi:hypothetical protein